MRRSWRRKRGKEKSKGLSPFQTPPMEIMLDELHTTGDEMSPEEDEFILACATKLTRISTGPEQERRRRRNESSLQRETKGNG